MNYRHPLFTLLRQTRTLAFYCVLITASVFSASAQNPVLDSGFSASASEIPPENYVSAVQPDGKILVGGKFEFVNGFPLGGLARLNPDGSLDTTFNSGGNGLNGHAHAIGVLDDGKILIGGNFTQYNGMPIPRNLLRLNPDGSHDPTFNPGGIGVSVISDASRVTSLAYQADGKVVVGGQGVSGYNGVENIGIFRINADGTLDTSFTSGFASANVDQIEEVAIQADGMIVIALDAGPHLYMGVMVANLIRINPDAMLDPSFVQSGTVNGSVYGLAIQPDGTIVIGGAFTMHSQTPRAGIARVHSDGTLDESFAPPQWNDVAVESILVLPNGQILASGAYSVTGFHKGLVRFNSDGSEDTSFSCLTNNYAYHIALQLDGKLLLTGFFSKVATGETRVGITRLAQNGLVDASFNPVFTRRGGAITAMALQPDGKIVVGGTFIKANGTITHNLARFTSDGNHDASFNAGHGPLSIPDFTPINAISVQPDGKILIGGPFEGFNGSNRSGLVRLNADGSIDGSFIPSGVILSPGTTFVGVADILVLPDSKILITGDGITTAGSPSPKFLVRLNADGSLDTSFDVSALGTLTVAVGSKIMRQPDSKIIVAGNYRKPNAPLPIGGNIVRFNSDGTSDPSFTPFTSMFSPPPPLSDVALQPDGKIISVGSPRPFSGAVVARLNPNGTADPGFRAPNLIVGVFAVAILSTGKVLIGEGVTSLSGSPRSRLPLLNADGTLDDSFVSNLDAVLFNYNGVNSIVTEPGGSILVGGGFYSYNGVPRNNLLRLLTVNTRLFDYDGDGRSDISVFRPATGDWYLQQSSAGFFGVNFGSAEDRIVPADFDGDGKTDVAVYRPSTGIWYVLNSSDGSVVYHNFGLAEDLPAPADYDGDGKADVCVFRPSTGTWYRLNSSSGEFVAVQFGAEGDRPTVGDFDGDGKSDIAVYRPSEGAWYQINSSDGSLFGEQFGIATDRIAPADYDGDGKTDIAIYRPSDGLWYVKNSGSAAYTPYVFGLAQDIPVPGDFDGDGKADIAVFRPSDGTWYIVNSSTGGYTIQQFGQSGDKPTQSAFDGH